MKLARLCSILLLLSLGSVPRYSRVAMGDSQDLRVALKNIRFGASLLIGGF